MILMLSQAALKERSECQNDSERTQNPLMLLISVGCYFHVPRSKRFRNWLANIFYKTTGLVVKSVDLKDAINIMSAKPNLTAAITLSLI